MRKFYLFINFIFVLFSFNAIGQGTVFSEDMGSPAATTAVTSYTGFQNYGTLTYAGTADVRTSSPSSGYAGASGSGNVYFASAGKYFEISGINTTACSSYTLTFGLLISSTLATSTDFTVSVSTNGTTYTGLTLSPTINSITSISSYSLITITSGIPSTANLRIRFTNATGTYTYRVDDVTLISSCASAGGNTLPQLTGIVTDACDNNVCDCGEGSSEVTLLSSGTYTIDPTKLGTKTIQYWGSAAAFPSAPSGNAYSGSFTAHTAITTSLNTTGVAGCGSGSFIDAITTSGHNDIPPGATIMMVPYNFCPLAYDLSALCSAFRPIYVLYFSTTNTGTGTAGVWSDNHGSGCTGGTGNYGNNGSGVAYVGITFPMAALSPTPSPTFGTQYYTYDKNLEYNGNGASEGWSGTPSTSTVTPLAASAYTPTGSGTADVCTLPIVLPISLIEFKADKKSDNNITLNWVTATETDNDYFMAEYSFDGVNFIDFDQIKGAGTSLEKKKYNCIFPQDIGNKTPYFRLKQVDNNGHYTYSLIITLDTPFGTPLSVNAYYNTQSNKITATFNLDSPQEVTIGLYDVTGVKLNETSLLYNEGNNEILLNAPDKGGIYVLVYQNGESAPIRKKIIVSK